MEELFDFGFSSTEEIAAEHAEQHIQEKNTAEAKVQLMLDTIGPLLDNLEQNPDSDIIKWPGEDRVKAIRAFRKKLQKIATEGDG